MSPSGDLTKRLPLGFTALTGENWIGREVAGQSLSELLKLMRGEAIEYQNGHPLRISLEADHPFRSKPISQID